MMWIAVILGALGLICMLSRRTVLGFLVGTQLLILGATLTFVLAGVMAGVSVEGQLFGVFATLSGVSQLIVGYALATRLFYLRKRAVMDDLRSLKN